MLIFWALYFSPSKAIHKEWSPFTKVLLEELANCFQLDVIDGSPSKWSLANQEEPQGERESKQKAGRNSNDIQKSL